MDLGETTGYVLLAVVVGPLLNIAALFSMYIQTVLLDGGAYQQHTPQYHTPRRPNQLVHHQR